MFMQTTTKNFNISTFHCFKDTNFINSPVIDNGKIQR